MPSFQQTPLLVASERGRDLLSTWKYRYAPFRGMVRAGINTTGAARTVEIEMTAGSDAVVQRSHVCVGGTAGVIPAPLNVPYFEFIVNPGDLIAMPVDELAAAAPTVNFFIAIDPL